MGASWLHGVCDENPLAPLIRRLGLTMYRTSGDNSVLYDHDLESFMLFDMDGHQVPQNTVVQVGDVFKKILSETEKVRNEHSHDLSVLQAISIVLDRHPELRQEGLSHEVLQWYICRMEARFTANADTISLKTWDQEQILTGGHGLMVQGYHPVIKSLSPPSHKVIIQRHRYPFESQVQMGFSKMRKFYLAFFVSQYSCNDC